MPPLSDRFPAYTGFDPAVPVRCVTVGIDHCIHRFFDTPPFSPSGRYLALTRLPTVDRVPEPGEAAEVIVVDLATGDTRILARTRGWDTQLGAQVQWGGSDHELFFNDVDPADWQPYGVKLDPANGRSQRLEGGVYMLTRDGRRAAAPCLLRTVRTQEGYGVIAPDDAVPVNHGAPDDDGIFVTDTATGRCRLLVSLAQVVDAVGLGGYRDGGFYGAHVKWNLQATRLMLVLRWVPVDGGRMRKWVITLRDDGSDIRVAIPTEEWDKGGHHPDWCPDGERVLMNLKLDGEHLRFVTARYDGSGLAPLTDAVLGSGHPTLHPDGRHILTDSYPNEPVAYGDGSVPIRWVDVDSGREEALVRIGSVPPFEGPQRMLRVDPHPAWDRDFRRIAFNGCPEGVRRVYVADLSDRVG